MPDRATLVAVLELDYLYFIYGAADRLDVLDGDLVDAVAALGHHVYGGLSLPLGAEEVRCARDCEYVACLNAVVVKRARVNSRGCFGHIGNLVVRDFGTGDKVVLFLFALAPDLHDFDIEVDVCHALSTVLGVEGHGYKGYLAVRFGKLSALEVDGVDLDARVVVTLAVEELARGVVLVQIEVGLLRSIVCNCTYSVGNAENTVYALAVFYGRIDAVRHINREL